MAAKQVQKRVGDTTYTIQQFTATRANRMLVRLVKQLGPFLTEVMTLDPKKKDDPEQVKKLAHAIQSLAQNLTEDEFDSLCKDLLEATFVGTQQVIADFDLRFQGKLFEMYKLLAQVVMVNYSDFLAGLAAAKPRHPATSTESESPSLNT